MNKIGITLIVVWAAVGLQSVSTAADFCVDNAVDLQAALSEADTNGQDDTIRVVQGTYLTLGVPFSYNSPEDFSVEILGGYTSGCAGLHRTRSGGAG